MRVRKKIMPYLCSWCILLLGSGWKGKGMAQIKKTIPLTVITREGDSGNFSRIRNEHQFTRDNLS